MATVVITGASRGIGLELVRQYAGDGDHVFALCRTPAKADQLKQLAEHARSNITIIACDVVDEAGIDAAVRAVDGPVDILINNAGISGPKNQTFASMDFDGWRECLEVMAIAPLRVGRAFFPALKQAKAPKLVTITSQLGASTWPGPGILAYSSAKAAVNRVMRGASIEMKDEPVIFALIHPGHVRTDMGGPSAALTAEESAMGVRKVISGLTKADSGKFYKWNGDIHPC